MCLAQGQNAVTPVRLEPPALGLESSTLPLRSLCVLSDFAVVSLRKSESWLIYVNSMLVLKYVFSVS